MVNHAGELVLVTATRGDGADSWVVWSWENVPSWSDILIVWCVGVCRGKRDGDDVAC